MRGARLLVWCSLTVAVFGCRGGASARVVDASFWFEADAFGRPVLGRPISPAERQRISSLAMCEVRIAFARLPIRFSERPGGRYHVRVVDQLRDPFGNPAGGAGQSRAVGGFGGSGSVSFEFLANNARRFLRLDEQRSAVIAAIGRAIGRTAVHEFTHQLLPKASIHAGSAIDTYEHASAARVEQYYGPMAWGEARLLLERQFGSIEPQRVWTDDSSRTP